MKFPPTMFTPIKRDRYGGFDYRANSTTWRKLSKGEGRKNVYFWALVIWARIRKQKISTIHWKYIPSWLIYNPFNYDYRKNEY